MSNYRFFFSYSHLDHKNAQYGRECNYLEDFFEELCKHVSSNTPGEPAESVAYRDQDRIQIGDYWSPNIIEGLKHSRVLVSMLSSTYLASESCGREFQSFLQRFYLLQQGSFNPNASPRIIPVFWGNSDNSLYDLDSDMTQLIKRLQLRQEGVPEGYPTTGLRQYYYLGKKTSCSQLGLLLADRIVERVPFF